MYLAYGIWKSFQALIKNRTYKHDEFRAMLGVASDILPFSKEVCANCAASAETLMTSRVIDVELEFIMSDFHFSFHLDLHL